GAEQRLVVERLGENVDGARPQRADLERHIAVPGDEDDREVVTADRQDIVKVEPGLARHPDVEDETGEPRVVTALQKSPRRCVRLDAVAPGSEQPGQASPDGRVIVDDGHDHAVVGHSDLAPGVGSEKWKVAPAIELSSAQMSPPCASMIDFEIARPMPIPDGFVV